MFMKRILCCSYPHDARTLNSVITMTLSVPVSYEFWHSKCSDKVFVQPLHLSWHYFKASGAVTILQEFGEMCESASGSSSAQERVCASFNLSITPLASGRQDPAKVAADRTVLCGQLGCSEARGGMCLLPTTAITDCPEERGDALVKLVPGQQIKQNPI